MRGQGATEFLLILGFILLLILPVGYHTFSQSSESSRIVQAQLAVSEIAKVADYVYYQAPGAKQIVTVFLPGGVEWNQSYVGHPSALGGKELNLALYTSTGDKTDILEFTQGEVRGSWPDSNGNFRFEIKKTSEGYVLISPYEFGFILEPEAKSVTLHPEENSIFQITLTEIKGAARDVELVAYGEIASWITFGNSTVNLSALEVESTTTRISVPLETAFGLYYGVIEANDGNTVHTLPITVVVTGTGGIEGGLLVQIIDPQNTTYATPNIPLNYFVNESTQWCGWSLNGGESTSITGNTSIVVTQNGENYIDLSCISISGKSSTDQVYFTINYGQNCTNYTIYQGTFDNGTNATSQLLSSDDQHLDLTGIQTGTDRYFNVTYKPGLSVFKTLDAIKVYMEHREESIALAANLYWLNNTALDFVCTLPDATTQDTITTCVLPIISATEANNLTLRYYVTSTSATTPETEYVDWITAEMCYSAEIQNLSEPPWVVPTDLEFDLGNYVNTTYNYDSIQLVTNKTTGYYYSPVHRNIWNLTYVSWMNISWVADGVYGVGAPDNGSTNGRVNMNKSVLLLHLNEENGTVTDSSAENNAMINNGMLAYGGDGPFSNAICFNGSQSISTPSNPVLNILGDLTLGFWINIPTFPVSDDVFAIVYSSDGESLATNTPYELKITSDGYISYKHEYGAGSDESHEFTNSSLQTDTWYFVFLERNVTSNNITLYLNGELNDYWVYTNDPEGGTSSSLSIGSDYDGTDLFDGCMDEVMIFEDVVVPEDIKELYERGIKKLWFQVRSCNDSACSGESWVDITSASPQILSLPSNEWLQYRVYYETNNESESPKLFNTTVWYTELGTPGLTIDSPINITYAGTTVWLNITTNISVDQAWYSLDGESNSSLSGSGIYWYKNVVALNGSHNVTFYANNSNGETGASETRWFSTSNSTTEIAITQITPNGLTANFTKGYFNEYTVNVSCNGTACGNVDITLDPLTYGSTTSRVSEEYDDVEEDSSGAINSGSSDLELIYGDSSDQEIGIRFQNVDIPYGATITDAYIEFECDEATSGATSIVFYGEDADNAAQFDGTSYEVTNKEKTTTSVQWNSMPAWVVDTKYQSPDLSTIVQEISDRNGWSANNSMVFIVNGSGTRTAESFDGEDTAAPLLIVNYTTGKGIVPTTDGARPFYTNNSTNPFTINVGNGETKQVTFWVNATGNIGTSYDFFAYANLTSNTTINAITNTTNVTIKSEFDCPQTVDLWELPTDSPQPLDYTSGLNTSANTFGAGAASDGWDWEWNVYDTGSSCVYFNDNLYVSAANPTTAAVSGGVNTDNLLSIDIGDTYGCAGDGHGSGAYAVLVTITADQYSLISNGASANISFDWTFTDNSLDTGDSVWVKARFGNTTAMNWLGTNVGGTNDDANAEIMFQNNPASTSGSFEEDVSSYIGASGNYYIELGARLRDWDNNEGGDVTFDNVDFEVSC